ncbi:hypothetical protein JCM1841_004737 [Sporobolomyces salmonicolor]
MPDSLFGSDSDSEENQLASPTRTTAAPAVLTQPVVASSTPPPIPGLYLFPHAIPLEIQHKLTQALSESVWIGHSNQVMLFDSPTRSALPIFLEPVLDLLPAILAPLPSELKAIIFDSKRPRQAILNLYFPGQGISPHCDLPARYDDGIVGVSLLASTVMDLAPVDSPKHPSSLAQSQPGHALRLRPGDVYVLSGPARWDWTHGIAYRDEDLVEEEGQTLRVRRRTRMSITLRRMKVGADWIGPVDHECEMDTEERESAV